MKFSGLYEHLPLKVRGLSKELSSAHRDVSACVLRTLKGFCMAKSAVDLDVTLSKYGINGIDSFEIVRFGLRKPYF